MLSILCHRGRIQLSPEKALQTNIFTSNHVYSANWTQSVLLEPLVNARLVEQVQAGQAPTNIQI